MAIRITKYPQSCLLVEVGDARLLIDPGTLVTAAYSPEAFGELDAVLYTHRHGDHFDLSLLDAFAEAGARFVANEDVAGLIDAHEVTVLGNGESTRIDGVPVEAHQIPHCLMVDGSPGPPNVGYLVDGRLLHPGDGADAPVEADVIAVPIAGPSISFRDAYRMIAASKASHAIPVHYDVFIADPSMLSKWCDLAEVHVLADGQAADIDV